MAKVRAVTAPRPFAARWTMSGLSNVNIDQKASVNTFDLIKHEILSW